MLLDLMLQRILPVICLASLLQQKCLFHLRKKLEDSINFNINFLIKIQKIYCISVCGNAWVLKNQVRKDVDVLYNLTAFRGQNFPVPVRYHHGQAVPL